ncbi:hypothetical protein CDG81_18325 [Actinopolyspora erythraea]|uniref:Beta-hydroxyacyl-ACP dehydratase n=1 Tax=Actinopolyspora erythraea TaxID=414996 RepID=A0A223RZD5_9ACTN|nr:hypothetical protein CDG81_18325 [Actinopolyspora erythraea]
MSVQRIRALLPHRYPMLLVDRVVEAVPGERLVARKAVTVNEPCYADVADDTDPRYPASLLVESWGQSAALLAALGGERAGGFGDKVLLFGSMAGAEFHGDVHPGDVLEHHVSLSREAGDTLLFEGHTEVSGNRVFELERAVLALRPSEGVLGRPAGM